MSFYFALGDYPLLDNNEGLYASIAKNMLLTRDFIIPKLNCVPYLEKPPLLYWLLSFSFHIVGFSASAARFITSTSAALICVAMVYLTRKIRQHQIGVMSAVIFSSSIGVCIIARMVYFEMLFTLCITLTLFSLFYWYDTQKKYSLRLGYFFFGLAILTKGLVAGIIIGGSFFLFLLWEGNVRYLSKIIDPLGVTIFLAVALPWHIAAILQHEGFARKYLFEEHVLRFLDLREPHDYYHGPIYYYLPRILIYLLPWSFFIPLIFRRNKDTTTRELSLLRFCWCWVLVPLIFFSVSRAKANYYMIVSAPAITILLSIKLKYLITRHNFKIFNIWAGAILILLTFGIGIGYFFFSDVYHVNDATKQIIVMALISGLSAGILCMMIIERNDIVVAMLSAFIIPFVMIAISGVKGIKSELSVSSAPMGVYLTEKFKNTPLFIYQDFEEFSAIAFYSPACLKVIDCRSSDLDYGKNLPMFKGWFVNKSDFLKEASNREVYVIVPNNKLYEFYQNMLPGKFFPIKKFSKLAIVSNKELISN